MIEKRKPCHNWLSGNKTEEVNVPWLHAGPLNIWQTLQNIQWKHYSNALKSFKDFQFFQIFVASARFVLLLSFENISALQWNHYGNALIYFRDSNKTKLAVAKKTSKTNYIFFVKPTCFLLTRRTRRSMTNFWSWLWQY